MEKIQWGIIGCGDVTEVKSGPAFNKVPDSMLQAVMRRDAAKAADYAKRHGVPCWYADAQALIDDPQVNAIYVATPPDTHEMYTLQALQAGKPVYVEKPMSTNSASAKKMWQAAEDIGIALAVAHYRKEQPRFKKIKALLLAQSIGNVRMVNLQLRQSPSAALLANPAAVWRVDPAIAGGGLFHDLSPHQLDLLQYFFGPPVKAEGFALNQSGLYAAPDFVSGRLLFANNIACIATWCFAGAKNEDEDLVEIIGNEGSIRFATFSSHHFTLTRRGVAKTFSFDELAHVQQPMIAAVVQYFLGRGPNPSSAADAVVTMEIIDAFTMQQAW
ncbi:MAG TPA: Gfo/Idh/MocA family oxidoreductase [Chitinophagaceae bacterium]|nr:Gfo/Idh/MocA family oxidoreductase [Chitinophagaceae bacterium]